MRKTCLPRKTSVRFSAIPQSLAPIHDVIAVQQSPKIGADSDATHRVDVNGNNGQTQRVPELLKIMDIDDRNSSDSDENVKLTSSLSELMGFNPKTQRAVYMTNRRSAKKAAYPLLLDRAWQRYSQRERDGAVERVFLAFGGRLFHLHLKQYQLTGNTDILLNFVRQFYAPCVKVMSRI